MTVWNINQISLSMIASSFMKDTRNSTLIGYQGSIFMILFISIVSQFLFPNPGNLPYFFQILPHSQMIRYMYLQISKCIDYTCYASLSDIKGEMLVIFVMMHIFMVLYAVLGVALNEPVVRKFFTDKFSKTLKFVKLKKRVKQSVVSARKSKLISHGLGDESKS